MTLMVADAQVHVWTANTPQRPWPTRAIKPHRTVPFGPEDLLVEMRAAGIDRAVLVPPSWEGDRNDVVLDAAQRHPRTFAVMGRFDPTLPGSRERLSNWRSQAGMLGMRFNFAKDEFVPLLTEGHFDWVWPAAEKAGIPLMVLPMPSLLPRFYDIAARHPGLRLVMDHFALHLGKKDESAFADFGALLKMAVLPNIVVKTSALPAYSSDPYPYRNLFGYIRQVYDAFGPRRMMWGTDITRLPCTYRQAVTMFTEEISWLNESDKEWIMGRTLCHWLGWT